MPAPVATMSFFGFIASLGLAVLAVSCRGYDTVPIQEADWQRIQPELVGMSSSIVALRRAALTRGGRILGRDDNGLPLR